MYIHGEPSKDDPYLYRSFGPTLPMIWRKSGIVSTSAELIALDGNDSKPPLTMHVLDKKLNYSIETT